MRTFVVTKNGIGRIMRTYANDPETGRVEPDAEGAPDAMAEIAKWHPDHQAQVTGVREIAEADIPPLFGFKDAWVDDGVSIVVDMPKARAVKTDLIRKERDKLLPLEDIELMKASEAGDTFNADVIKVRKQKLRDMPTAVQAKLNTIKTIEALEAFEPTWP